MIEQIFVVAVLMLTALSLFARLGWPFELFTHFRPHFVVLALIGALWTLGGDQTLAAISAFCALINLTRMAGAKPLQPNSALEGKPGVTVVWANVWKKPQALKRTIDWARSNSADLILIGEFPAIDSAGVAPDYPTLLDTGKDEGAVWTSRIVAFSRLPTRHLEVLRPPGRDRRPFLKFVIDLPGGEALTVAPIHPAAPIKPYMLKDRNDAIRMLGDLVHGPFLIAGDFNATPWCPVFPKIPGRRIGVGLTKPTWLTSIPMLGLPIDHITVSKGILASRYEVGPFLGSDHRALLVRIHPGSTA